ncbi:MAG: tripartite tricarboxylate transporter TctB family protein [Desulfobacterales bacterium]|nr:tripartite tricarboxylate transporter TctB family protein [Desulfobacterales bacterium]
MNSSKLDLSIGIILCVLGAFLFLNTYTFPPPLQPNAPGSATFPRIIIIMMMFFGIIMIYQSRLPNLKTAAAKQAPVFSKNFVTAVGLILMYLALLQYLGFVLDSFLYLCLTLVARINGRIKAVLVSAVGVACFYLIFAVLLNIRLPKLYWLG